jgi:hypothetical protein
VRSVAGTRVAYLNGVPVVPPVAERHQSDRVPLSTAIETSR